MFDNRKSLRRACFVVGALLLLAAFIPRSVRAQNFDQITTGMTDAMQSAIDLLPPGINNVGLGLGPAVYPDFEGARTYTAHVVPVISFRYRNWVEVVNNEVHITAFSKLFSQDGVDNKSAPDTYSSLLGNSLKAGPLVSLNFGRSENDSPALKGLGDVGISFELGGFISYTVDGMRFRLRARQDVADGHKGATVQADITKAFFHGPRVSLSGFVAMEGASAPYMKSFFGVTGTQSLNSGLPVYHAAAGLKDASTGLNGSYTLSDHWTLFANVGYERLLAGAADSPLVQLRGSANQATLSSFAVYFF